MKFKVSRDPSKYPATPVVVTLQDNGCAFTCLLTEKAAFAFGKTLVKNAHEPNQLFEEEQEPPDFEDHIDPI